MEKVVIPKKELEKYYLKTFSLHEKRRDFAIQIQNYIKDYKHFENMLIILSRECWDAEHYDIVNLLHNKVTMKAVSQKAKGKEKTKDNIKKVCDYFKNNDLFHEMVDFSKKNLNGHNVSMIVARLKKDWDNSKNKRDEYFKDPSKFKGKPQFPKPKKLQNVFQYSIPLEGSKWSTKKLNKNRLGFTLSKRQILTFINANNEYLKNKKIKSMTISLSHGHIYYNFTYVEKINKKVKHNPLKSIQKEAGLDIGVVNLASLFINDFNSSSLILSGRNFKHYNSTFNRKLAKLNELISKEVIEFKEIKNKKGELIKVPLKYSEKGIKLRFIKSNLFEKRKRYFDDQFNKLSKKILEFLKSNHVTHLMISKNLSFTKQTGEIQQRKKTKQNFYQIPFGKLLNLIEEKSINFNIDVKDIDEAYTSKTSCLSSNVVDIQALSKAQKVTPTDLNGNRGVKQKRGLFRDSLLNKLLNSDLNGAANHIKLGFPDTDLSVYRNHLHKVCNPIKITSTSELDKLLNDLKNSEVEKKTTLQKAA